MKILSVGIICLCLLMMTATPINARAGWQEAVKQTLPKVRQHLPLAIESGKVAISAACAGLVCLLNLAAFADTSYLDDLLPDTDLVRTREPGEIFDEPSTLILKSAGGGLVQDRRGGISFERSVLSNPTNTIAFNIGAIRFSSSGKWRGFNGYLTSAFTYPLHTSVNIDNPSIQMSSFAGVNGLLVDSGKDKISYGMLMVDAFTGTGMMAHSVFGHLLHYYREPYQIAVLGYEYLDMDLSAIAGDIAIDGTRTQGLAIYRAGLNLPITDRLIKSDAIKISLKLNSIMLLGGMGAVSFGDTWQDDLNNWAKGADLNHSLHHTMAGSLRTILADGRIKLIVTASKRNTIRGSIRKEKKKQGEFDAVNTIFMLMGSIDVIPQQRVSLEASFSHFNQTITAEFFDGAHHETDRWTTYSLLAVRKLF